MKRTSFQIVKLPTGKFTYAKPPPTLLQFGTARKKVADQVLCSSDNQTISFTLLINS